MVAVRNEEQTILLSDHLRIISEKDRKIHQLEKQLRFRSELDGISSEIMSQNQKAALSRTVKEIQSRDPEPDGWFLLKETDKLAKDSGMATKTYQKCLTYCDTIETLEKKTKKVRDEDTGEVVRIDTYVKPTSLTFYPRLYEAEKSRNHGGDRLTCKCGSDQIEKKVTYICKCCGEVYNKPPKFHPSESVDPPIEPVEPEDQFGSLDKNEEVQKPNLTLLSNNYPQDQLDPLVKDESNNPPLSDSAIPNHIAIISDWLRKRRGTARIIQATGILKTEDKYKSKPEAYELDIEAYIQGKIGHIYGSWLRNPETGLTSVLSFDFDSSEYNELAQDCLLALARAGAAAIYWQRQRNRGHLELYFDRPVNPEVARLWAIEICPDLADVDECFPSHGKENRQNTALSWPMWQRIEGTVHTCTAYAILPAPHAGDLQIVDPTNVEQLSQLVTNVVTPATLIEEFATVLEACAELQNVEQERESAQGGVIGIKPLPITHVGSDRDFAKQVIADFNRTHCIEDMVELNKKRKFCATWRGERTPSVALDRSGEYATDYGQNGSFPKKLDAYELYCLLNNIEKKADLAERCAQLRGAEIKVVQSAANAVSTSNSVGLEVPATELFATEEQQHSPAYATCIVCEEAKSIKRADGAYVCSKQCQG